MLRDFYDNLEYSKASMIILDAVKSYNNSRCCEASDDNFKCYEAFDDNFGCCEVLMIFWVAVRHFMIIWNPVI